MNAKPGIYRNEGGMNWSVFTELQADGNCIQHNFHNQRDEAKMLEYARLAIGTCHRPYSGQAPMHTEFNLVFILK